MDSILVSRTPDAFQGRRHLKRTDFTPIPLRYHAVLSYHLAGLSVRDICEKTGYKEASVYTILKDPRVVQIRQSLLDHTQQEFEALYPTVVARLRENLHSLDPDVSARAIDTWFRASGKSSDQKQVINVTAEDVVFQILNQASGAPEGDPK